MKVLTLLFAVLIAGLTPQSSLAQSTENGRAQVFHSCAASSNGCSKAVDVAIKRLEAERLSPAEFNSRLGTVAGAIAEATQGRRQHYERFEEAIDRVANASTNASQRSAIRRGLAELFKRKKGRRANFGRGPIFGSSPS